MEIVILTAIGVGASTVIGALLGFIFGKLSEHTGEVILAFGAGVMLWAAILGLIIPSLKYGEWALVITPLGVILGGAVILLIDKLLPMLDGYFTVGCSDDPSEGEKRRSVLLFVLAIAVHNLPEGIASGVAFGTGNFGDAMLVSGSIALQNIPEGMVIISPMISIGITKRRALIYAAFTGVVEVLGVLLGYYTVQISKMLLPLFLALAGGCMLFVIVDEMGKRNNRRLRRKSRRFSVLGL